MISNHAWCQTPGIDRPDLGAVKKHSEANTYACLIVPLLERGTIQRARLAGNTR